MINGGCFVIQQNAIVKNIFGCVLRWIICFTVPLGKYFHCGAEVGLLGKSYAPAP